MNHSAEWHDQYEHAKEHMVFTSEQHHIPGVRTFAYHLRSSATPSLDWHYHKNAFEFSIVTKGSVSFSTKTSSYDISSGDVFISFPNEIHGTDQIPFAVSKLYWFQLDISDENQFLFLSPAAARHMIDLLQSIPNHVVQTRSEETYPLIKTALALTEQGADPQHAATYLQLFLHILIRDSREALSRLSPDIDLAIRYIREHIADALSLEQLAEISQLSCSQFKQKFKKQFGISPRHFINQQKIEAAQSLLLAGMSVTETAMHLNFTTSSYFSTVFRKYTSYTPQEYKINKQKETKPC